MPDVTEEFLVDVKNDVKVSECLSGAQANVHVVSAEKGLWTYGSNEDLSKSLMTKACTQVCNPVLLVLVCCFT